MSRSKRISQDPLTVTIESLSHEGRGITHINGKTVFVDETLPDERVVIQVTRQHSRFCEAKVVEILEPSPRRIAPKCDAYSICGGCCLQHTDSTFQVEHKQRVLLELFRHNGGVTPVELLPPLTGKIWGYRRKARLGVKYVEKKQKVLIGFREKRSSFIADIQKCEVLHPKVGYMLEEIQALVSNLSVYRNLPQIEVAVADNVTVLIFRHLQEITRTDRELLLKFEHDKDIQIYLQPGGIDTVTPLSAETRKALTYSLPDQGIEFEFLPTDFIQVNSDINNSMVLLALELLQPENQDHVLDLFCGLGNFTLPLAKKCRHVTGVEVDAGLINRARFNADKNGIKNIDFHINDLSGPGILSNFIKKKYEKILLDPPRTGAKEILEQLPLDKTGKLLYVSCNPATLARDAGILVKKKGFHLQKAGVMDMFPNTSHIESIALFTH